MSMDVFLYLLVLHHCGTVPLLLIHGCPVPEDRKGIPTGENVKKGYIYIYMCVCVCVCERERERERRKIDDSSKTTMCILRGIEKHELRIEVLDGPAHLWRPRRRASGAHHPVPNPQT
jgi:hypothetical protein